MKKYPKKVKDWSNVPFTKYIIIVPTEEDRAELMEAFEHIHYSDINTDFIAVNQIAHEYLDDLDVGGTRNNIIVNKELYEKHCIHNQH